MNEQEDYKVIRIDGKSWIIEDNGARIFLFEGADKALLVDTGYGKGDLKKAVEELTKLPLMLVNTHADHDHIGGNPQFELAHMHPSEYAHYREELARFYPDSAGEFPVSPLWEGDIVDIGTRRFEVILTPGHTPGSISLLDEENGVLLAGDCILDDRIVLCHMWRNIEAYVLSLEKLNGFRGRFSTVYPPHGTFPVSADILDGLISGIKGALSGEIEGVDTDFVENTKMFDVGAAKFIW